MERLIGHALFHRRQGATSELPLLETLPMIEVGVVFSRRIAARRAAAELLALSRSGWPVSKSTTQVLLERQ
jgi:hypothetical protein